MHYALFIYTDHDLDAALGRRGEARAAYERALDLSIGERECGFLRGRLADLGES